MQSIFLTIFIFLCMNHINACTAQKERLMPIHQDSSQQEELSTLGKLKIIVGHSSFTATFYDNATAKAFKAMLPMTIMMSEHNGNEKYNYLPNNLPASPSKPKVIHKGDIMLFGADCLVLFYKTFNTSYSYTPIGMLNNKEGLEKALGAGNISVKFEAIN